jgi:hypothetical protein
MSIIPFMKRENLGLYQNYLLNMTVYIETVKKGEKRRIITGFSASGKKMIR